MCWENLKPSGRGPVRQISSSINNTFPIVWMEEGEGERGKKEG